MAILYLHTSDTQGCLSNSMYLDGKSDHVHLFEGSLIKSSSRYRAAWRPRHGSLCPEPQNSCLQIVFWVFVGGSMALCRCTHTSVVQPRCVYTHLGGLPKLDTLRFWPGYMCTHIDNLQVHIPGALVRVYTPWELPHLHIPRFEAEIRVYTLWQL